ncbi:glycosyl transferase family group 2-domain-containing protein [Verticillium dahliae]|uniref:Glycosyltransferase 2-like domain-containing protein n=1 Tax=Verticillium dahliae TaxID=27337 RepID=A0AA44WIY5_VERDA|nr:hypothetical protein VdG2_04323 [Verticillium dahliae VDG2]KAH6694557.1 glycosyl transferase family group 2-domain-containing protein [Verticillium dahliae]PNH32336.1 hypothetical protein BJF96_g4448 [Verticillium dahliae]PNH57095.1 hypothetical protein VD0003_g649 [Verticillium dahliae]
MKALKNYFVSEHPVDQINTPGSRSESESSRRSSTNHRKSSSLKSQSSQQPPRTNNKPDTCLPVWAGQDLGPVADIRAEIMVQNLWQDQLRRVYASGFDPEEGAVLKKGRGDYICAPASLETIPNGFFEMVRQLNVSCAITVNSPVVQSIMLRVPDHLQSLPVSDGLKLQVLPSMRHLPSCHKHHFAAFVKDPPTLVVWDDDPQKVLSRAENIEQMIVRYVWHMADELDQRAEKGHALEPIPEEISLADLENGAVAEVRPLKLSSSIIVSLALCLSISCLGLGWRALALQTTVDGSYLRMCLIIVAPLTIAVSLFFFLIIVADIFELVGPVGCVLENSQNYSGKAPRRLDRAQGAFPHVTIQMPVYKEGLNPVIKPTVLSVKTAISTYEMQGGSANIFVNDDGMQLLSEDEAQMRREFYDEHNIGWTARPKHDPKPKDSTTRPFVRRGRFKKASNMNYGLRISNLIEDKLLTVERHENWNQDAELEAYRRCMDEVLEEDEGRTMAGGNVRIGEYILLIDSDTRVPSDCLLDAVSEMEASPQVAIIQYTSGVMNVSDSFFEKGVTWFTNLIYTSITFAVALGDIPPFVGHNAILRWSALQDAASYICEHDQCEKFWSESHVSEDFDMALRLQTSGYQLRFGAYTGDGFKEGVSLTVYDELMRWEKYAYGVNELLFHPFRKWPYKGPFTPLFHQFVWSNIPFYKKCTIMAYITTYYAIGLSWPLTLLNYFLTGWFFGHYDKYYIDSFAVYFAIIVVFPVASNVCLAVLRYRLGQQGLIQALITNFKWAPLFTIFLGGISLHVSKALLCHFFEINIQWGATSKEVERCNFLEEVPKILKSFCGTFVFCFLMTALMVCGMYVFPRVWRIDEFASIYPLASVTVCHFLLPVLLNPALMKFSF